MNNQILISIVVPVYNAEKYICQCLDSLLAQGIPNEDYEIICVNDGSQDHSLPILTKYAEKYPNIIVIDKINEGVSAARNKGLDIAQGKYVWFIDADDWISKDFLRNENIRKLLSETPLHVPMILANCIDVYEQDIEKYTGHRTSSGELTLKEVKPFMTTARGHLIHRNLLVKHNLRFDTNLAYGEDLMFMREILDVIRFENENGIDYRILQCVGDGVYFYRLHKESAMGQLHKKMESVAGSILYRARFCMKRHLMEDMPTWYRANYQEYVNLFMQEYMLYYFPALKESMWGHLKALKEEGLYPSPPPKLGWVKQKSTARRVRQFVFRHPAVYPLYYIIMRMKFRKAGSI